MLYPSEPSCSSSKVSAHRSDERISEPDPVISFGEAHTPNFSIRDYVFASRSKNSGTSWPFPRWLLELFLKHGVEDLLPPFEPPSTVRLLSRRSSEPEAEKIRTCHQVGEILLDEQHDPTRTVSCLPSDENLLRCLDKDEGQCSSDQEDKPHNLINDCELGSTVTIHCDIGKFSENSYEPVGKKRRLILPGVISETSRTEETASTSIASDPMAPKVCPVCKTFSSTSNTTLNAHMDQCLSMASDTTLTVDEVPKQKVKPRKKRLMEDIYATASHCSLEDLDRRNGTSWATSLILVSAPREANSEAKKLESSQVDARDERSEGAVYVDSNGIKLRILSNFNSPSEEISREVVYKPRKNKHVGDAKIIAVNKKKFFWEKHAKKLKLKMENKNLRSLKLFKNEAAPEAVQNEGFYEEERPAQLSGEINHVQVSCETATLQRWPSSKRSYLPKKLCEKDFIRSLKHSELATQMRNVDTGKSVSGTFPSVRRHIKLKQLPESKLVDFTPSPLEKREKSSRGGLSKDTSTNTTCCKLARASEALMPSPRSRNDEFCVGRKHKLHDPPLKTIRISSLTGSNQNNNNKIGKRRSFLHTTAKRKRDFSFNNNGEQRGCAEASFTGSQDEQISDQCLNTVTGQFQDANQTCSKRLFINIKTSFDKVDSSSITVKSLYGEGTGQLLASDDKSGPPMPKEECGMMMEQLLLDEQDGLIHDNLERKCVESEAGPASTESSACLTSHGDLDPDIQRENCSIASTLVFPNQGSNSAIVRELSRSPTSNSFIFNPPLNGSHPKASEGELGRFIDRNQHFQMNSIMNKPQQQSDYHHCCCSYQSIMAGTMPTSNPKIFPNLYIKPSITSSFGAYSNLRNEMANAAPLESPTGSMVARACNIGSTSPSCGTPSQSSSNSILRLMGKDLMICHNEDSSNLPKFDSPAKDNNFNVQSFPSPLSFSSCASVPNHESFPFAVHSPASPMANMQACSHLNNKAYLKKDVIVINGSSDDDLRMRGTLYPVPATQTMFQGVSPYFMPHNQLLPSENGCGNYEKSSLDVQATLLPRPFMFRSPSTAHLNASFYYPQSLR